MPACIPHDRSPRELLADDVLDIFERRLIRRQECEPISIASLARPLVLDNVGGELHRRRIVVAPPLPRRRRQQHERRLVGVLDAERIVRCAMHAQETSTSVPFLGADQRDDLGLNLRAGECLGPVLGFLIERSDRREPVVFTRAVKVGSILAEPAQRFGELGRLLAGDCAGQAETRHSPFPYWSIHAARSP